MRIERFQNDLLEFSASVHLPSSSSGLPRWRLLLTPPSPSSSRTAPLPAGSARCGRRWPARPPSTRTRTDPPPGPVHALVAPEGSPCCAAVLALDKPPVLRRSHQAARRRRRLLSTGTILSSTSWLRAIHRTCAAKRTQRTTLRSFSTSRGETRCALPFSTTAAWPGLYLRSAVGLSTRGPGTFFLRGT